MNSTPSFSKVSASPNPYRKTKKPPVKGENTPLTGGFFTLPYSTRRQLSLFLR